MPDLAKQALHRSHARYYAAIPFTPKWWKTEGVLGECFPTQAALKTRIRAVVGAVPLNGDVDNSAERFLVDVLRRHHHWEEKQGTGIVRLMVRLNPPPGYGSATRGLWIARMDAPDVDISWQTPLLPGGGNSAKSDLAAAARAEVSQQTRAVFEARRGSFCELCGRVLDRAHVDHAPPLTFDRLLTTWLEAENLAVEQVEIQDRGTRSAFTDRALAARWGDFHLRNAVLRVIHPEENLSRVG